MAPRVAVSPSPYERLIGVKTVPMEVPRDCLPVLELRMALSLGSTRKASVWLNGQQLDGIPSTSNISCMYGRSLRQPLAGFQSASPSSSWRLYCGAIEAVAHRAPVCSVSINDLAYFRYLTYWLLRRRRRCATRCALVLVRAKQTKQTKP